MNRMGKRLLYKHSDVWHWFILLFLELLTSFNDSKQSRIWYKIYPIFLWLFNQQTYLIYIELFHITIIQSRCWYWTEIHSFSYSFSLYIASLFHIFKRRTKNFQFLSWFLFFLFVSEEKSYKKSNTILYCSYSIISSLFNQFSLVLWDTLDMDNFYFIFLLFSDFIGILFLFLFSFLFWTMKRHMTLQSHNMSHDVIS